MMPELAEGIRLHRAPILARKRNAWQENPRAATVAGRGIQPPYAKL